MSLPTKVKGLIASRMEREILAYEEEYGMSTQEMLSKVYSGKIEKTHAIIRWISRYQIVTEIETEQRLMRGSNA